MGPVTDPLAQHVGSRPATSAGSRAFIVRPFQRLARTHVANNMADAMLAAALADSIFFSLPADNARGPVLRYLIITMAPFAVVGALLGLRIPRSRVADEKADPVERQELRGAGIQLAQAAMALLRGFVGFLTMLIAFDFRGADKEAWQFGLVAGISVLAGLIGAAVAPRLKGITSEETILTTSLGLVVSGAF